MYVDVPTLGITLIGQIGRCNISWPRATCYFPCRTGALTRFIHARSRRKSRASLQPISRQECANGQGAPAYELYKQGNIDGIVDFDPGETDTIDHFYAVIVNGIESIGARNFVADHPEILTTLIEISGLEPSPFFVVVNASSTLKLEKSPTEYPNVFGVYRYLRYLPMIKATTTTQYVWSMLKFRLVS